MIAQNNKKHSDKTKQVKGQLVNRLLLFLIICLTLLQFKNVLSPAEEPIKQVMGVEKYDDTFIKTLKEHPDYEPTWEAHKKINATQFPTIQGTSGIVVELNKNNILYEKNSNKKLPIASLVKVMTAVVALEHSDINKKLTVSDYAASIGENTMELQAGEQYTLKELLYGLMLHSGNDAAYVIAEGVAGDANTFTKWMNNTAKELGLENTYFADPSGLDDSSYSTVYDLVKVTRYAMKDQNFRNIVKTVEIELESNTHAYKYLYNQTNLLTTYPGVQGVKTGYTELAGLCLITYANNEGHEVIGVVLGSPDRKGDMILMLDHAYSTIGINISHTLLDY